MSSATAAQAPATAPAAPQTLPGGVSQLQETHGDWRVICVQPNNQRVCVFSQQLSDKDSRQFLLGIELKAGAGADTAEGTLVLPFGLAVDQVVTLQIDNAASTIPLHFKTCVPLGCLVVLTFDRPTVAALKKGTTLSVKAIVADDARDTTFSVSLNGFGSAIERTAALTR